MIHTNKMLVGALMLALLIMVGCTAPEPTTTMDDNQNNEYDTNYETEQTTPQTIPSEQTPTTTTTQSTVIVNGEEIAQEEIATMQQVYVEQGIEASNEQIIEQLISQKVLEQETRKANITVSNEEAESAIESQLTQQGASLEQYKQQLQSQGITYEERLQDYKMNLAIQLLLQSLTEDVAVTVTEEEKMEFYETYSSQSPEEVPPYEELEAQITATLEQQKQQEAADLIVQKLRANSTIEYQ